MKSIELSVALGIVDEGKFDDDEVYVWTYNLAIYLNWYEYFCLSNELK